METLFFVNEQELSNLDKGSGYALTMCCKALVRPVARVKDHCIASKEWESQRGSLKGRVVYWFMFNTWEAGKWVRVALFHFFKRLWLCMFLYPNRIFSSLKFIFILCPVMLASKHCSITRKFQSLCSCIIEHS